MTPKQKKIIIAVVVLLVVFLVVLYGHVIYFTFHTAPSVRKKMINHYSNDKNYVEVQARITETPKPYYKGNKWVFISVEFIGEVDKHFKNNSARGFEMPLSDYDIMVSNGVDFEDREAVYKFLASPMIWWDGGQPFAIAVFSADGKTTYLDYETGKKNLLYYIKNDMD